MFSDDDERKRLFGDDRAASPRTSWPPTRAAFFDYLEARPEVSGTAFGTTGLLHGRPDVAGGRGPACPSGSAAAMSFHGGGLATDDPGSPHLLADQIRRRSTSAAPRTTRRSPPSTAETLDKALTAAGVEHTIEFYPAAHGFAVPDNAALRRGCRRAALGRDGERSSARTWR